jgi:hypothetical protein
MCSDILNLREKALIPGQNILVSQRGQEKAPVGKRHEAQSPLAATGPHGQGARPEGLEPPTF